MNKIPYTLKQIKTEINHSMANSDALDGDCKECRVKRVRRTSEEEAKRLGRNWNIDIVNGECQAGCMDALEAAVNLLGKKYQAI